MEYFAAEALSSRLNKLNKYISAPFVRNRRRISTSWDEVAHMTVGLIDLDEFIARLALYDPLLAVDCLEHTSRDYSIKKETLEILIINLVMLLVWGEERRRCRGGFWRRGERGRGGGEGRG